MTDEQILIESSYRHKQSVSLLGDKLKFLAKVCCDISQKKIPGEVAECGVYKGGSARLIATAFPDKKIYLFDSYDGFEKDDSIGVGFPKGFFSDVTLDSVKEYLDDRPNCLFFKGWLPESAKGIDDRFCLIHMDMDHYDSTIQCLNFFWPKIVPGGAIIFDDWEDTCCPGVKKAITEFFPSNYELIISGNQCVVFKIL